MEKLAGTYFVWLIVALIPFRGELAEERVEIPIEEPTEDLLRNINRKNFPIKN